MVRGIQVEPDHVGRLRLEVRVCRAHVAFQAVWLQTRVAPGAGHDGVLHAELASQRARGPVRRAVRRRAPCPRQDARLQRGGQHGPLRARMPRTESGQTLRLEAPLPEGDRPRTAARGRRDARVGLPSRELQNHPRPTCGIGASPTRSLPRLQLRALLRRQGQSRRWHGPSYALQVVRTSHLDSLQGRCQAR